MARKTRIFGPGLVVVLILAATTGLSATAQTGGHFTTEVEKTYWVGVEQEMHRTEFNAFEKFFFCQETTYDGKTEGAGKTFTEVQITPYYSKCITTDTEGPVTVTTNGCKYIFTIGKKAHEDNTVHLSCPPNKKIEVSLSDSKCKLSFAPQTFKGGVAYTAVTESKKHALTIDVTMKEIKYERHEGLCIFLGTNGTDGEVKGSVTVVGYNFVDSKPASITATGSEGTGG